MRYMIMERFKGRGAEAVYRRARDRGRMLPEGLVYVDSWVSRRLDMCFQLMECEDKNLLRDWMYKWRDLVDFEVIPVMSSAEASAKALGRERDESEDT